MAINRQLVHAKYDGHCAYCGQEITLKQMQVDHIWPSHLMGKDIPENLAPSCRQCNHYKRGQSLETFRRTKSTLHERVQNIYIHKVAVNFGMATIVPWDGKFYFEKKNRLRRPDQMTSQQKYEIGFEIVAGMHASAYNQDIERGRLETLAGTILPTPEELATEGLTEIPDYCHRAVQFEKKRLDGQIAFITQVLINKLGEMGLSIEPVQGDQFKTGPEGK